MRSWRFELAFAMMLIPVSAGVSSAVLAADCGCNGKYSPSTCKPCADSSCVKCRHCCHKCCIDRCPPQGAIVSSMPAMFVAPFAFAQPSNFVTMQSQPTLTMTMQPTTTQNSVNLDMLRRAVENAMDQQLRAQRSTESCNKSGNGNGQAAMQAPTPPSDNGLEDRVKAMEGAITGLQAKVDESVKSLNETSDRLKKIVDGLQK